MIERAIHRASSLCHDRSRTGTDSHHRPRRDQANRAYHPDDRRSPKLKLPGWVEPGTGGRQSVVISGDLLPKLTIGARPVATLRPWRKPRVADAR